MNFLFRLFAIFLGIVLIIIPDPFVVFDVAGVGLIVWGFTGFFPGMNKE